MKIKQLSFQNIFIAVAIIIIAIVSLLYFSRIDVALDERYSSIAKELHRKTQTLIDEKKETILLIALSMSHDEHLRDAILSNQPSILKLDSFAKKIEQYTSLKDLWFQIVKNNGDSFYRSWTKKRGDKLSLARLDIASMLENPHLSSSISTGKFDLTFKAMVPIYEGSNFIGIFEVIAKFNSIAKKLENESVDSVFLVDKSYKKQLTKPFSKIFIGDYYVTNVGVKEKYLSLLESNSVENYIRLKKYKLDKEHNLFISYFSLLDIKGMPMGHFILFKSLDDVFVEDIYNSRNQLLVYLIFLVIFLFFSIRFASNRHVTQKIKELNHQLEEKVSTKNKELINQGKFLQNIMDGVSNAITVIDKNYNVTMMNKVAQKNTGYDFKNNEKLKCYAVSHHLDSPCSDPNHKCPHQEVFTTGKKTKVLHEHFTKDGKIQFIELNTSPLFDQSGEVEAVIEIGHDITEHILVHDQLQEQKNRLAFQAHHDALTGLPNRVLFVDRVKQSVKQAAREDSKVAILFIDLDRFKEINDTLGHNVGDKILIEVANRLKNNIRKVDTVARLGGDEFTLILANIHKISIVIEIAEKIVDILAKKILHGENELYITASIGISIYPDDGDNTEILLRNADSAMYQAKDQGRNNYQFYTKQMTELAFERALLEKSLRKAIKEDEFIIFYQPQYNSRSEQVIGMEALLRWQDPEMGMVSPAGFIPIAEETGMIVGIGWLVIDKVIKQLLKWKKSGYHFGQISINLSVKQIQEPDFIQKILNSLEQYSYQPQFIQFEVTESYIMTDPELAIATLKQLKDLGFSISIDDFGTGYSSLSYLKRLPVDELKIDQSFVRDVPGDEEDEAIVRSIISLAKSLKLNVIAEGVETKAQQEFLLAENCENIQGYLFHKPACALEITNLLNSYVGKIF